MKVYVNESKTERVMSETIIQEISKANKNLNFEKNKIINNIFSVDLSINSKQIIEINGDHHLNRII
jgi:predicted Mrr-cat superfamily restriction endonuclease